MNILISGGTGFLGKALMVALTQQGHHVTVLSRDPRQIAPQPQVQAKRIDELQPQDDFEVVVNLAGAGIADKRWSEARKAELLSGRLQTTQALVQWMALAERRPQVFLSGSAIGWYGAQGETTLTERSAPHDEFVHQLCRDWEHAAQQAEALNIRTVLLRTGVVLHPSGGMLGRVWLPFQLGLGGRLGDGQQWLSWISRDDWVAAVLWLLTRPDLSGAVNLSAPNPVRNQEFTRQLAQHLRRPALLPAPAWLLKLLLGEMSGLLLDSQRVLPERLLEQGFAFSHPELSTYWASLKK